MVYDTLKYEVSCYLKGTLVHYANTTIVTIDIYFCCVTVN